MGTTPPPPLVIKEISAVPDFCVQTTDPDVFVTTPYLPTLLFSSTNPQGYLDDSHGSHSTRPVVFYIGQLGNFETNQTIKIGMQLTVDFTFPSHWRASGAKFQVEARLKTPSLGDNPLLSPAILTSGQLDVNLAAQPTFTVALYLRVPKSIKSGSISLPFKIAGDFMWRLRIVGSDGKSSLLFH